MLQTVLAGLHENLFQPGDLEVVIERAKIKRVETTGFIIIYQNTFSDVVCFVPAQKGVSLSE